MQFGVYAADSDRKDSSADDLLCSSANFPDAGINGRIMRHQIAALFAVALLGVTGAGAAQAGTIT